MLQLRYLIAAFTVFSAVAYAHPATADSFGTGDDAFQNRRTPVMQYGTYNPPADAPVAKPIPTDPSGRPCCRNNSTPRWYVGASGYMVFLQDDDIDLRSPLLAGGQRTDTYNTDLGYGFSVYAGYRITPAIRAEIEVARRENDLDKLNGNPPSLPSGTYASQRSTAYMANLYYDYETGTNYVPYIGAGIGAADVKAPVFYPNSSQFLKEWTMAYQFMAGVSYTVQTDFNQVSFNFGYRYFTGDDLETKFKTTTATATFVNDSHNLEIGGKFYF